MVLRPFRFTGAVPFSNAMCQVIFIKIIIIISEDKDNKTGPDKKVAISEKKTDRTGADQTSYSYYLLAKAQINRIA